MRQKVVVDVDAGSDDAVALLLLLALEREKNLDVVGVTCTHGNTTLDNVCKNVLTTLESISRLDVPVYRGAEGPLIPFKDPNVVLEDFHGKDGFGDSDIPHSRGQIQLENGVAALNRLALENKGIILICLAPLTTIALALRTYPEFSTNLNHVYIMGGNSKGVGNSSSAAEFNFYKDPEAAHIVLSTLTCPITVLPWEPCMETGFTLEERFKEFSSAPQPHIQLINKVESKLYRYQSCWNPCDALLMTAFLDETFIRESKFVHFSVELHGAQTRGQGVIDHRRKKKPNVRLIEEINVDVFRKLIRKMASFSPTQQNALK